MTLGVLVRRLNQLRHVEGAVREAHVRGHRVEIFLDSRGPQTGPKGDEFPRRGLVPSRFDAWATFLRWPSLVPKVDALLVPAPLGIGINVETPPEPPLPPARAYCALQTAWSDLMYLRPDEAERWDAVYTWSARWADWWQEAHGCPPSNFVPVGLPVAEHLRWIDPAEVRTAFGIAPGPVVLYLPFPFGAHEQDWRLRYLYRLSPWGDRATVRAVRTYCDRQGAQFVVKSRAKTPVPAYLADAADVVVDRDEPGEPTLLRLLTTATLMVHHTSSAVAEAAAAGVRALSIVPPHWTAYEGRGPDFDPDGTLSFYGWTGLSVTWPAAWARRRRLENAGTGISGMARDAYVERFLGGEPFNAGKLIIDDLEKRL